MFVYGIRGNILKWFDSYLTNRSQFIMYDNVQSETRGIKCGVPQGLILKEILRPLVTWMNTQIINISYELHSE